MNHENSSTSPDQLQFQCEIEFICLQVGLKQCAFLSGLFCNQRTHRAQLTMKTKLNKQQTEDSYLKRGGFRVYHFDKRSLTQVHKIISNHSVSRKELNNKAKQPSPSALSNKSNSLGINSELQFQGLQDNQMQENSRTNSNVKENIKKMINKNMAEHKDMRMAKIFQQQQDKLLQSAIFKEAMKNIIHKARTRGNVVLHPPSNEFKRPNKKIKARVHQNGIAKVQELTIPNRSRRLNLRSNNNRLDPQNREIVQQKMKMTYQYEEDSIYAQNTQWKPMKTKKKKNSKQQTCKNQQNKNTYNSTSKVLNLRSNHSKQLLLDEKQTMSFQKSQKEEKIKHKTKIINKYKKIKKTKQNKNHSKKQIKKKAKKDEFSSKNQLKNQLIKDLNSQYEYQTQSPNEDSAIKVEEIKQYFIGTLPVRNPKTVHAHNSVSCSTISISQPLKKNKLHYASRMVHYDPKQHELKFINDKVFKQFVEETIKSTAVCKSIPQRQESQIRKIKLRRNFEYQDKKTLILDLDQTLIHSSALNVQADKSKFPLDFQFDKVKRHFAVRNHAKRFIRNLASKFYLVVFTSAVQGYADKVIEYLDPEEKYIQHRLYRCSCYCHGLTFPHIKDLRILNRDLSQVILVDNSFFTFWFNIDNGVPILPFRGVQDDELLNLQKYLLTLQNVDDVREVNRRAFHMHLFKQLDNPDEIMEKYYKLLESQLEGVSRKSKNTKIIDVIDID